MSETTTQTTSETIRNLTERRSPRAFTGEHVSREAIDAIVAAGLNAPSGMNTQNTLLLVIQDEALVAELSQMNATIMREFLAKVNPEAAAQVSDPFYGAKDVIAVVTRPCPTAVEDGSLVMGNLLNAAWSLGVDSRWIHRAREIFASEKGKAILAAHGITDEVIGIGFCILGARAAEPTPKEIKPGRVFYA